jgi:hypothetical protein
VNEYLNGEVFNLVNMDRPYICIEDIDKELGALLG